MSPGTTTKMRHKMQEAQGDEDTAYKEEQALMCVVVKNRIVLSMQDCVASRKSLPTSITWNSSLPSDYQEEDDE